MKRLLSLLFATSLSLSLGACSTYQLLGAGKSVGRPAGWSERSHSHQTAPDYARVFPQDEVKKIAIAISAADWKLMQDNMTELFGNSSAARPGAAPGGWPGGFPPPEGGMPPPGFPTPNPVGNVSPNPASSANPSAIPSARPTPPAGLRPGGGGPPLEFSEEDPIYRPCTVTFEGQTWTQVGIRYKGNSSLRAAWGRTLKMPFRFDFDEFEDEHPEIKNQRFFGFKRLTFSSGFSDNSLIREKVAADIFRKAGIPSAQTAFYRVYLDYGQGQKYLGLYTLVEAPDTPMLATQFKNATGNLYKPSGTGAQFGTFEQKSFPKKTNETTSNWQDIQNVFAALHASRAQPEQWRAGLEKVFDVKGFLKWLATNTLIQNWDSYGRMAHNYYLYNDPSDGLIHWIPWDNNMALSSSGGGGRPNFPGQNPSGQNPPAQEAPALNPPGPGGVGGPGGGAPSLDLTPEEIGENWPLIRYLIDDPVYKAQYVAYVALVRKSAFGIAETKAIYQKAHSLIRPYVVGAEGEQTDSTLLSSPQAFETALEALYTHLDERHKAADTFLAKHQK